MFPTRRRPPAIHPDYLLRPAELADLPAVRLLDDLCFPADSPDKQRAEPGELEQAVRLGEVQLLLRGDTALGYLHADTTVPGRIYVSGLAVDPAVQGRGLGNWMVRTCLDSIEPGIRHRIPIVTVTSPRNLPMLRILFHHGFAARWVLEDFFGPGRDRFGLQLSRSGRRPGRGATTAISADLLAEVYRAITQGGQVVYGVRESDSGPVFLLATPDDKAFVPEAPPLAVYIDMP